MKSTYLVQRLQKPYPGCENNPFVFGGGLCRGGMNETAYKLLNQIFRFDYMGSAEFEFGAVPTSIGKIVDYFNAGNGVTGEMKVCGIPVYYLCFKGNENEVKERIKELGTNPRKYRTKESIFFDEALAARVPANVVPEKKDKYKFYLDYIGWLELDNDFMFFLDKEAFDKLITLITSKEGE